MDEDLDVNAIEAAFIAMAKASGKPINEEEASVLFFKSADAFKHWVTIAEGCPKLIAEVRNLRAQLDVQASLAANCVEASARATEENRRLRKMLADHCIPTNQEYTPADGMVRLQKKLIRSFGLTDGSFWEAQRRILEEPMKVAPE